MKTIILTLAVALSVHTAAAQVENDSITSEMGRRLDLDEVVVVARHPVLKQQEGKLTYLVKNDPYAKGLDGMTLLDRIPRVSAENGAVTVAGKGTVRYIIDGVLMELDASAMKMRLQNLKAENIEKIELLSTPPSRYAVEPNAVYISITTRNETLGTRGSLYGSLNMNEWLREYFSGSISHSTRRVEMSFDASLHDMRGKSDETMEYIFPERMRRSITGSKSDDLTIGLNALFRYKFTQAMSAGVIANYAYDNISVTKSNTTDYGSSFSTSHATTESCPNNALTITGFFDWTFGKKGERMELTYNYFNRHTPERSKISTEYQDSPGAYGIVENGATDYVFNSGKADFTMPYSWAQLEAGVAYTDILNSSVNSTLHVDGLGNSTRDESNDFDYSERIAAAYLTASRNFGMGFWGKAGLRYEYTWIKGTLMSTGESNRNRYGRLFPTINLSWSKEGIGGFNLNYSMGMGRPNLWELNPFRYYSSTDDYSSGNPELQPTIYHNAEINYYGLGGLYAVLYTSFASDAVSYIRRFDGNGVVSVKPYNALSTNKTGLYANYRRNLFRWWEMNVGGEVFRTSSACDLPDYSNREMVDWSGKIELSSNWMLNRSGTLKFNARFTHFFPWQQNMVQYRSFQLFSVTLRYSLLNNRLNLHLKANDIFGWNKTRSKESYADYTIRHTFDAHSEYVQFGVSFTFGRDKVNGVYRSTKEDQSGRTR